MTTSSPQPPVPTSLDAWLGKTETLGDDITAFPLNALAATLDRPSPGDVVPPMWHWLYFLPVAPLAEVGPDGHPKRGGFLPPVPLPRRMWAGGRLTFHAPLRTGRRATRESTIENIEDKTGRSGRLVFVTVQHRIECDGALCVEEEHDIVYRDAPQPGSPAPKPVAAPGGETRSRTIAADAVMLFRYSALTFNGHRIHYDRSYVTQEEGYPGLVVHGPLIATLLVDLVHRERPDATLASFAFRAVRPTFDGEPFTLCGKPSDDGQTIELWAKDRDGWLTMQATATLA
ncbi:acyl-CoA dehydrogenase [Burkholderia contaminans FFH2055]|uniref:FAS1-like dehydratase domain-containing protein n=1 Tax=Burkholderia contaminans TaxID=488447 RepID=UPI000626E5DE|nr:MaoC family dehydratase N-terminal domain-containing protein [Burkholderia contaminans]KKL36034.1 acyl-CoA dehydrogenase [Burkholderia contaminans FFH2055]MEB4636365.1 MaoC family dehydratase N-terminal domain-containing protein [Burkholderia contaminans]MEB4652096.1 MaoC family dehydratase N-terminal domain-containing protein [Burkholderia contaminans]MEB4661664.1 MaoC family dehydratase N-terminal domain-containing protein [Burkholderia contaminans]MEB4666724.1 MaoC family dehydratase N-t